MSRKHSTMFGTVDSGIKFISLICPPNFVGGSPTFLLTSAQRSAEVRALQRALSFSVCMCALCGLCFTDFGRVAFSCKQRFQFIWISPDKATKQSRDLSVCLRSWLLNINNTSKQKGCFVSRDSWTCMNKISMLKKRRILGLYYLTIANKSIPDSLHKIHWILKHKPAVIISGRRGLTGSYDFELLPW